MRKLNLLLILLVFLPTIFAAETLIDSKVISYPPYNANTGVNQYYTINFDEEGDAATAAKLEIQNFDKDTIKEVQVEIPGNNIRVINLIQEYFLYTQDCSNWQNVCSYIGCTDQCSSYYQRQIWPPVYESINYETIILSNSVLYKLKLPHPINQSETNSVILYYKTNSYTDKSLGIYNFNFETIKINYDTNNLNVGVSVSPDLYLKGAKEKVNYRKEFETASLSFASGKTGAIADVVNLIGQGSYYKNANSLDPLESFTLTGSYSKSFLNLYRFRIILGVLIFAVIIIGAYLALKKLNILKKKNAVKCIWTGIASSLALIILWALTSLFLKLVNNYISYDMQSVVSLMILLLIGIISLFVMFGPIVYFGLKYSIKEAAYVTVSFLIFLVIFGVVATIILVLLMPSNSGPIYRYAMEAAKAVTA